MIKLFRDEHGFTTLGMAVALLVTLSLIFTTAQVYRINAASADVQDVADASALAAENDVAEFMVAVKTADAIVLSMTLLSSFSYAIGIVAMCVPPAMGIGEELIEAGGKIIEARNTFAQNVAKGLNVLQQALPFLCAADAVLVAQANGGGVTNAFYQAIAVPIPSEGAPIVIGEAQGSDEMKEAVEEGFDDVRDLAEKADELAQQANEIKEEGYQHDCGLNPDYCMYQRAETLADMLGVENPYYASADTWSFSVALKRAQEYYRRRLAQEAPASTSVSEQANSALRKRFYAYAVEQVSQGYVVETDEEFDALFPELPKNTSEMRATELYTEAVYPITNGDEGQVMHAWEGCPQASGASSYGSIAQMESGGFGKCPLCEFTASSLGKVAAASTSIENGFEYHYNVVAQAAKRYEEVQDELKPALKEAKEKAGDLFETCFDVIEEACGYRIEASPPGSKGMIALVANVSSTAADTGFENSFVGGGATLGARAAVSGATLLKDTSAEGKTVLNSLLDGLGDDGGALVGTGRLLLDCWSGLLEVYGNGVNALTDTLSEALGDIPLIGPSGLGEWAANAVTEGLQALGLEPADTTILKPALINTAYVAAADDQGFAVSYRSLQQKAMSLPASSSDLFTSLVTSVESDAIDELDRAGEGIVLATIEVPVIGVSVPLTIAIPPSLVEQGKGLVEQAADGLRGIQGAILGRRTWE